jgi:hypothetical protein
MPCKSIASGKLSSTLSAFVRPFASVEFHMALEIVQSAEASLTVHTLVWLFLTVCEQMTLEIVMAREFSGTVGTFVAPRRSELFPLQWIRDFHRILIE